MTADVLATQGARASAVMVLTMHNKQLLVMTADVPPTQGARASAVIVLTSFSPNFTDSASQGLTEQLKRNIYTILITQSVT